MLAIHNYIGIPFVDGGRDRNGCDCWGLAMLVYKEVFGIELPDYKVACDDKSKIDETINENKPHWEKVPFEKVTVPALVVLHFNSPILCNHTGVYIGNGEFIHTARKVNSHIVSINSVIWKRKIEGFYVLRKEGN